MFDFAWSELALIGIVGLIFIGPKDMPTAIRAVTNVLKKGRKLAGEFQTHVDEMVREADLGDARESFRELRGMNLRGQVMKALDGDGSLRRTLADNPLSAVPAASATTLPGAPTELGSQVSVSGAELLRARNRPHSSVTPMQEAEPMPEADDPAPVVIPPRTAARMRRERAVAPAPAFMPPGVRRPFSDLF
ncbi:Sec-independent protein translocase protein TatB [Lichenicoccus sp.]|uniref:Sec-independent protein translocase protein TatB n=1 Tax=Lichenicoccus sp. TaxID=2781899 RepID=UPI003D0DBC40